jgi:DNA-3-methyladenine glycosylase II
LDAGEVVLRGAGLSRQKVGYLLDLSQRTLEGDLDFEALEQMTDAEVIAALTAVKGIGVWTAKMYLIFRLQRPDVCPFEDLGVRLSVAQHYGLEMDATTAFIQAQQAAWSPYNSLAARVLWAARGR